MKKITDFDITIKGYNEYQDNIKNLYPGQFLELEIITKSNGYKDVLVKSIFGTIGEMYSESSSELIPYLENFEQYYVETFVKKFYVKDNIKIAPVIIIDVFEKSENFIKPEHPFLGDYYTDSDKYIWNETMDDISPMKCSVSSINDYAFVAEDLDEWEDCKLVINGEILDVYSKLGSKFGNLSKQTSQKLIPYLQNPDNFISANITSINQNDEGKWSCRLEISIYEKSRLKAIEDLAKAKRKEEWEKDNEKDKKNAPFYQAGCLIGLIGLVGLLGITFYTIFINNEATESQNNWMYIFIVMALFGCIPLFFLQKSNEKHKQAIEESDEYKEMFEKMKGKK